MLKYRYHSPNCIKALNKLIPHIHNIIILSVIYYPVDFYIFSIYYLSEDFFCMIRNFGVFLEIFNINNK